MDWRTTGFPVLHHLLEFTQTHVYWVCKAIQPSPHLSSPSPPAFSLSQYQGLFPASALWVRWPTYLYPHLSCSPLLVFKNHQRQWFHPVSLGALSPSTQPSSFIQSNGSREGIIFIFQMKKLRFRGWDTRQVTKVIIADFVKDDTSVLFWHLSFHSQVSHSGQYILWALTFLACGRERTGMQISMTDSKSGALCYPRLPLNISEL